MDDQKEQIKSHLFHEGYVALKGVKNFVETYERFLAQASAFISLPKEVKDLYCPEDYYARGWSMGVESLKGKVDNLKGSYYAKSPDVEQNIWPAEHVPGFKEAFLNLCTLMDKVGTELLTTIDFPLKRDNCTGRMLYYLSGPQGEGNDNWCGTHLDHGMFTGLCPEVYFRHQDGKDGERVERPENSGLFIEDKEIRTPSDVMLFQVGEIAQILSNDEIRATGHYVKQAPEGYSRFSFAHFFDLASDHKLYSKTKEFSDRFVNGMTYEEWAKATYNKYY